MLDAMEPYLTEITPLLIGAVWFIFGLYFALRERAASKAEKAAEGQRAAA